MFAKFGKDLVSRDLIEAVKKVMDRPDENKPDQTEELKGGQVKLDKNRNGKLDSQDFKMLRGEKKGVAEAEDTTKKYEMMHRNGQVKRFVAKDDADAKRIAAGHGAKSVIRMKSNVPGDKIKEQGVAEGWDKLTPQQKAHEYNLDAAQRELDRRHEQGEDMTGAKIDKKTYKIVKPKQQGVAEAAEPDYKSSAKYRGKVGDFKPKASDVGQGRKIAGKMGKYGKQPDDDEKMVEPPKDQTVGDVKTDPSAVVPGHSTMAAKLHLASLPKDKEGNPIVKGARKVSAADLVAKRKAMMAGQKNEEVESLDEVEDTLHPAGAALLKHIKPEHHNLYKPHLTKDTFNGSYGDRTAVLKAAKDAGHLKMDLRKQNEEVTEKVDPNVRTTDTLKGRIAGGDSNQHTSYKVKLETKGTGALDRIKSAAKSAFDRVKNETMMGKAGATSEAKKLDKEGY